MSRARDLANIADDVGSGIASPDQLGRRNLIINGAMQVAQRGTSKSFSYSPTNSGYLIDRFDLELQAVNEQITGTYSQDSDAPNGFSNSLKWTTGTPETSIDAEENMRLEYHIEAQDLQHLKYGTASAQSLTLSFWVKSSVAGTYAVSLYQADGVRMIGSTYTIATANTWQYVTLTFAGDASGTINNDTGEGLRIIWTLASGSNFNTTDNTSWDAFTLGMFSYGHAQNGVMTTASATWQITGVQLEVGSVATPFEHRSYGEELALCQRYYWRATRASTLTLLGVGGYQTSSQVEIVINFPVQMRTGPSLVQNSGTNYYYAERANSLDYLDDFSSYASTEHSILLYNGSDASSTTGYYARIVSTPSGSIAFNAEL